MPELPEVEAVCRRLQSEILKAEITGAHFSRPGITAPQSGRQIVSALAAQTITSIRRRGKNILLDLAGGQTLHIHLRMTGDLAVIPDIRLRNVSVRAWFELSDGRALIFDDPRALGKIHLHATDSLEQKLQKIGIEPLSQQFTPEQFIQLARRSGQAAKVLLMDQRRVAGLGNIYAAEALFEARIDPRRPVRRLSAERLTRLHAAIVRILKDAVQSACIAYMSPGRFQEAESFPLQVYDREGEPCQVCRRAIRRLQQGGRSTYFCAGCQT